MVEFHVDSNNVYAEMRRQKVPKRMFTQPVMVEIAYPEQLASNITEEAAELILEAMKGYLIIDNSKKYVAGLIQRFKDRGTGITVRVGGIDE